MNEQIGVVLRGAEYKRLQDQEFERIREKYKMKRIEIEVLYALSRDEETSTPSSVARRYKLNRGHVSQAIDALSRREMLTAVPDKEDRRSVHYYPTKAATEIISEIENKNDSMQEEILAGLTAEEIDVFLKITDKMIANIRKLISEEE